MNTRVSLTVISLLVLFFSEASVTAQLIDIVAGHEHTCALFAEGTVKCWGLGLYGRLGTENSNDIGVQPGQMPPPDVNLGGTVTQIVAGYYHTCALLVGGIVRCWGRNDYGQLGYGHTNNVGDQAGQMPPPNVNLGSPVTYIASGTNHVCAQLSSGTVRCWGWGFNGQLGNGNNTNVGDQPGEMPPVDVPLGDTPVSLYAGTHHTCALFAEGNMKCWGGNTVGQLGYNDTSNLGDQPGEMPPPDVNVGDNVTQIALGYYHTCALLVGGSMRCWGYAPNGQLGYGTTTSVTMPPPDLNVGAPVIKMALGYEHTCAIINSGGVKCWGSGVRGKLGYESTDNVLQPSVEVSLGGSALDITMGYHHTCVMLSGEIVKCWGDYRLTGLGTTNDVGDQIGEMPPPDVNLSPPTPPTCPVNYYGQDCTCGSPSPVVDAVCQNTVWRVNQSLMNNGNLVLTDTILIQGNFTQTTEGTLFVSSQGRLEVEGCAQINGNLVFDSNPGPGAHLVIVADCVEGSFQRVEVPLQTCEVNQRVDRDGLSVLLSSEESCDGKSKKIIYIVVGSCVGGVGILLFVGIYVIWRLRSRGYIRNTCVTRLFRYNEDDSEYLCIKC